jgi:cytochrome c
MNFRMLVAGAAVALSFAGYAQLPAAAQAAKLDGQTLFKQRCQACHQVTAGKPSPIGPNLYGVVNRKAASAPVPFKYSEALKKSGLTWTRANLDKYLTAPAKMVPGTKMVVALPNPAQRAAIVDYLARAK